jgi:hypothetical protein
MCGKMWHWDMVFSEHFCFKGEISFRQCSVYINLSSRDDETGPFAVAVQTQVVFCFAGIMSDQLRKSITKLLKKEYFIFYFENLPFVY